MSASPTEELTPVERLKASRAQSRAVLLEAKHPTDSTLRTLLKPLALPLIAWASPALTSWLRGRTHKD